MSSRPPILPPSIGMLTMLAVFVLHFVKPVTQLFPYPLNYIGLVFIAIGAVINILADRDLQRFGAPFDSKGQSSYLVDKGLYQYSRNPNYLGLIFIAAGIAIWVGSLSPWLVVVILPISIGRMYICHEEQALITRYGEQYQRYCEKVPRWFRISKAER